MENSLPLIPEKRYFTISEVSKLCGVKPHVLRYWEQEFTQLRPMKRRGNRRYYQSHEVELIRHIRQLLHEQGFTIVGARNKLQEFFPGASIHRLDSDRILLQRKLPANQHSDDMKRSTDDNSAVPVKSLIDREVLPDSTLTQPLLAMVRNELMDISDLLGPIV